MFSQRENNVDARKERGLSKVRQADLEMQRSPDRQSNQRRPIELSQIYKRATYQTRTKASKAAASSFQPVQAVFGISSEGIQSRCATGAGTLHSLAVWRAQGYKAPGIRVKLFFFSVQMENFPVLNKSWLPGNEGARRCPLPHAYTRVEGSQK